MIKIDKMNLKKSKTIIIFTLYLDNEFKYPSFVHSHAMEYAKMGYNVVVFAQKAVVPFARLFKKEKYYFIDGVNVIVGNRYSISGLFPNSSINFNGRFYYLSVKRIVDKLIKSGTVILFDAHTFHCEGYTAYLLKKKYPDIKTTITFHGSDLEAAITSNVETKRIIEASKIIDTFICVSKKLEKKLNKLNINNTKTVFNGINFFKLHDYPKEKTIISCGNFVKSKSFELLVDAFNIFHKEYSDYQLKIIGSGPLMDLIKEKINNYHLNDCVTLCGQILNEEVYEEYEKASIFALISSPEGFGIVYPEAMYCGCITVGTKKEGIDGFIQDGKNGFLVNQDINEIVNILKYIVENDCQKIIENGKKDAKKLTWRSNCEEYLK